jgi:site-specific DNA-methyltransferase (adenine-specific)
MTSLKDYEEVIADKKDFFKLYNTNAVEYMESLPNNSIDILLTDPLYAIGADDLMITLGGKTGGDLTTSGFKIKDDPTAGMALLVELAKQSFRITTSTAHAYIFVGPERFHQVRFLFMDAGWRVHVKPLIWIKGQSGQSNVPSAWPSSCYEMLLYMRKDNSKLVKEGQPDWLAYPPVPLGSRIHPFEKPVALLIELLERVSFPGQQLLDPFAGSGASIIAGLETKLICTGVDNSLEAYSTMVKRIKEYIEKE